MHLGNVQAVIMADCNYLKQTNDTKGHEFGDMLLQSVADGIKAVLPEKCIAMRVGGDEILGKRPSRKRIRRCIRRRWHPGSGESKWRRPSVGNILWLPVVLFL